MTPNDDSGDHVSAIPIEPDKGEREALGLAVLDFLNDFVEERGSSPASWDSPTDLPEAFSVGPPELGRDIEALLEVLKQATETGFDTAGPGFLSYIPSGGLYSAALGTFVASTINRYTGAAHASPGVTAIEQSVVDWMVKLFGLPTGAGGLLLSGGSIANLTAVVAARSRLGDRFDDGVIYTSDRAHHSITKAARIAGIGADRVRIVATNAEFRIEPLALRQAVAEDATSGLRPMMIAATAGTTDTGAIDPLALCAAEAASCGAWFHVDAAYGGFFQLTERGRDRLAGIELADSITVDAHKSLFAPFGLGGLIFRDPAALATAHEGSGAYMQDVGDQDRPHFFEMGPELTKPTRGLPLWFALHLHGTDQFRDTLDEMLDLAEDASRRLLQLPGIELACKPELSVVAFRDVRGNGATLAVMDFINRSREVHVSSTTIEGLAYVRVAFLSQRTTTMMLDKTMGLIEQALESVP
ncbi:MAG: aromatic-L-amino-acid decarboxylase [Verrucomicrobiales bacterium]|jgi:aromatic-L-amino-acid decarboxylase